MNPNNQSFPPQNQDMNNQSQNTMAGIAIPPPPPPPPGHGANAQNMPAPQFPLSQSFQSQRSYFKEDTPVQEPPRTEPAPQVPVQNETKVHHKDQIRAEMNQIYESLKKIEDLLSC